MPPRFRWVSLLLFLSAVLAAPAQVRIPRPPRPGPGSGPESKMSGEFFVSGQVVDASTGEPVRKAIVRIHGGGADPADGSTVTDAGGGFSFRGLEPGAYAVSAEKPGYGPEITHGNQVSRNVTVGPNVNPGEVRCKLVRQGVIAGKVRDENNDPLPNAMVQAFRKVVQAGRGEWVPAGGQMTNDAGEYRMSVPPGSFMLRVTHSNPAFFRGRGRRIGDDKPEVSYPVVYYPNVTDAQTALPLLLTSGQEQHADFNLMPGPVFQVRGRLTNLPRQRGAGVSLVPLRGDPAILRIGSNLDMADGSFFINGVTPGTYQVVADSFSGTDEHLSARQTITVGESDLAGLEITLVSVFNVPVQVRTENGGPAPAVQVYLMNESLHQMIAMGAEKDGSQVIHGLSPGAYRLGISAGNSYVKSARLGGVDILDRSMEWNGPAGPIEIVLGSKGATLSGRITNGSQQVSSADVLVLRQTPEGQYTLARQVHATSADFTAPALAPGTYLVLAAEDTQDVEYTDPAALRKYQDYTQTIRVDESGEQQLQLKLAPVL